MQLTRKLDRYSRVKPTIYFHSLKSRSHQFCESQTEVSAALDREFDPNVDTYVTQPESFEYKFLGKTRRYTPDALVKNADGSFFYEEVKPYERTQCPKFKAKMAYLQPLFLEQVGHPLVVNTARTERKKDAYFANLELLYPFRGEVISSDLKSAFESLVSGKPELLSSWIDRLVAIGSHIVDAWRMVAHGLFTYDRSKLISTSSVVEVA